MSAQSQKLREILQEYIQNVNDSDNITETLEAVISELESQAHPKEETFLDRLIREEQELGEKIAGLATDGFAEKVGDYQFDLLCVQHSAMLTCRKVLRMRIADLKNQS
jgi:hypothetical protein